MANAIKTPSAETALNSASADAALYTAPYLTATQTALLLGCTRRFVERRVSDGTLRACKVGKKFTRIRRADLDAFLLRFATRGGV
jgi:excisionase family DNA binding protein